MTIQCIIVIYTYYCVYTILDQLYNYVLISLCNLFRCFISININTAVIIDAIASELGPDIHTPFKPKNLGKINSNGIRSITCLLNPKNIDILALPIA